MAIKLHYPVMPVHGYVKFVGLQKLGNGFEISGVPCFFVLTFADETEGSHLGIIPTDSVRNLTVTCCHVLAIVVIHSILVANQILLHKV